MTYCTGLRLTNFARFRGDHEIAPLEPKPYAIVARLEGDDGRSNWLGKSSVVVALRYLLFGVLPKDEYPTLDDAISRGEVDMSVDGEFSDGTFISRSRRRGKFATLRAILPDDEVGEVEFNQDRAQEEIERWLGMDVHTYDVCSHIAQKQADAFVRLKGDALAEVVNDWVGLNQLAEAEDINANGLAALTRELSVCDQQLAEHGWATEDKAAELRFKIKAEQLRVEVDEQAAADSAQAVRHDVLWRQHAENNRKAADVRAYIAALKKKEPAAVDAEALKRDHAKVGELREKIGPLKQKVSDAEKVARGEFDGKCPVAGIQCPAQQVINDNRKPNAVLLLEAIKARDAVARELNSAKSAYDANWEIEWARVEWERDLTRLEEQLAQWTASEQYIAEHGEPPELPASLVAIDYSELRRLQGELSRWEAVQPTLEVHRQRRPQLIARIAAYRVAAVVLGPEGAQRRMAEGVVESVERGANERLERAGIDLGVEFRWGRETKKPATRCPQCGAAFPASAKVKVCQVCSAPRGLAVDPKPYLKLSSRSGAAEDLAGVALTLARSVWVRSRRESPWSVVVLDEAFAALDPANCRALAGHVNQLVSDGFQQAFLIAHTRSVLESLPGRIEVVGDGDWSAVRVVA